MNNPEENLTPDSAANNVEIQRRFNELRGELLNARAANIDRWLSVIALVLAFFGIVVVVGGYISFKRFQEIETEAKKSVMILVDEIKRKRDESVEYLDFIKTVTAEIVADDPEEAKQVAANVGENPTASLIYKAIAQAVFFQQQGKRDEAIEKWRSVAHIAEGIDNDLAARAWFSVGYLLEKPEDRILAYGRAISLKLNYAEAYYNRGNAKAALKRYDEAIADYNEAIRLKPDDVLAYYNRGNTKAALEQRDEAIDDYDEAIRLKPEYVEA